MPNPSSESDREKDNCNKLNQIPLCRAQEKKIRSAIFLLCMIRSLNKTSILFVLLRTIIKMEFDLKIRKRPE